MVFRMLPLIFAIQPILNNGSIANITTFSGAFNTINTGLSGALPFAVLPLGLTLLIMIVIVGGTLVLKGDIILAIPVIGFVNLLVSVLLQIAGIGSDTTTFLWLGVAVLGILYLLAQGLTKQF